MSALETRYIFISREHDLDRLKRDYTYYLDKILVPAFYDIGT